MLCIPTVRKTYTVDFRQHEADYAIRERYLSRNGTRCFRLWDYRRRMFLSPTFATKRDAEQYLLQHGAIPHALAGYDLDKTHGDERE
jgi:hypothetical protein